MCGICGIAVPRNSSRSVDEALLIRMRDTLSHRGPDDAGIYVGRGVGLGHRRLSIVDLGGGHQPMANEDGSIWITYNGEVYNHLDLRAGLEQRGHQYRSASDTETILHLYEERGANVVDELRGMFSFAIWDSNSHRLVLARDRLGIKPLYYVHSEDGTLYFASEIKALLGAGAVSPEINFCALPDYLANHAPSGAETMFRGVKRLLPGHTLVWQDGEITIEQYWDVSFSGVETKPYRSEADYIEEWSDLFRASVRLRLMADVPLGMFLSGGIDSSAIAAVMSQIVREPIKTFSIGFTEQEANELEYARLVAGTFGTDHHEVIISPEEYFAALPKLIWHEDEPLAHMASVPLYFVSVLAARHVKVVLTGEGSDELLAGYYRYRKTVDNMWLGSGYYRLTGPLARRAVRYGIDHAPLPLGLKGKLARTFFFISPEIESMYSNNFAVFPTGMQDELLTEETKERIGGLDPYAEVRSLLDRTDADSLLNRLLYADMKTYLQELLMKQDQMSMAASIESRVPFLDHKLVEFTSRLPEHLKLRGWTTKYILRRAMKEVLPRSILRRPKMGFPVPVGSWFRGRFRHLLDEYVLGERALGRGLFDEVLLHRLVAEHCSGTRVHTQRLWSLVNLEMWIRQFIEGEGLTGSQFTAAEALELTR